jgi:hypothetical protein
MTPPKGYRLVICPLSSGCGASSVCFHGNEHEHERSCKPGRCWMIKKETAGCCKVARKTAKSGEEEMNNIQYRALDV